MSYKHNNLMAMRHRFWDESSDYVLNEKQFLQQTLIEQGIFNNATLEDVKYFFYTLPSIIIVKAHALGFMHDSVKQMLLQHIQSNRLHLMQKSELKIQFKM
ncbi:hypothetical protein KWF55_02390 [Acinetobacter pittii]|jgi:hypothetical protein|uniref:Uncharacterized protein n=2 Tax=Acinetobacter pittii TaxID=48296 RepID=A0A0M3BVG9_ACIPI|nr:MULTISPECIES: hypothetical protein [Acinetobacter]MBS6929039.1 hypothetical protein [Finegoldia magna]MDR0070062.1 hypothetical protein [Acinetobacter sp. 11520]OIG04300.1 hypothetical protein A7N09_32730 [Acinetobacter baumannii]AMM29453.1 hypothetical protein AYJ52_13775 [Acinetobacter pittii]AMX19310.1 hypothetical protein IEC338SC_2178 [Acinetobacter pittii]